MPLRSSVEVLVNDPFQRQSDIRMFEAE